ncbi:MAG: filamentous hemagglutinin N-terminal domain-containing protein [Burkholderiales bacterium]|nr:filamentous hemagglutinin N-terminal domain-containing protein [Burkholderiales bacterium]
MNRIYRSIWNQATGAYAAVSENVKSAGKRSMPGCSGGGAHFALTSMAAALMLGYGSLALAGPTGGTVVAGQATINGAPGATVINQGSQNAVINWASFNVGKGESVQFQQPNSNAVALNRVLGSDGTIILGNLSANGKVFIVNPNGVLFGQGASVNTAGLVASTLDISNADFMAGKYQFSGNGTGKVLNQGSVSAPGGYVALLGANVSNEGTIQARLGSVALAAGRAITLDVAGDGLLNVAVNAGAVGALVSNGGMIKADGGSVVLTAQAAGDLLKTVVNNTGVIEAQTIDTRSGTIKLLGDMQTGTVNAGGTLDASAPGGGNGGFVDTSAAHVKLDDALKVTTASSHGLTGTWLIDPTDYTIAPTGGDQTGAFYTNALKSTSVQIQSISGGSGTLGNINVNDTISWSANQLKLTAQNNININQPLRGSGTASLALEYGQANVASGNTSKYNVKAEIDLPSGLNFSTKLGSDGTATAYTVINSLGAATSVSGTDLQGLKNALSGNFVLGANIDASGTANTAVWGANGFTPIGTSTVPFTGQFDGLGHVITGLNSSTTTAAGAAGLFGANTGSIRNIGIVAPVISANVASGTIAGAAGLVVNNSGIISNAYVKGGTVTAVNLADIAGLTATNSGSISDSYNASTVISQGTTDYTGGLVGKATATSTIINSYNSGNITSNKFQAGGLVSDNFGSIANSFNTGTVTANTNGGGLTNTNRGVISDSFNAGIVLTNRYAGGLAASTTVASKISNSYSSGTVTNGASAVGVGSVAAGGLVGYNLGAVSNSYATGAVAGTTYVGGVIGRNGASGSAAFINNVYSSGTVAYITNGSGPIGGLVGSLDLASTITNGYFNQTLNPALSGVGTVSGSATVTSVSGLTATQMQTASNFANFTFTTKAGVTGNNWVMVNTDGTLNGAGNATGATGPMLSSEYSTTIKTPHQLQLMAMNLAGNYTLGMDVNAASTGTGGDVWNGGTFVPVGTSTGARFTGTFDGAGHVISGLVVNRPGTDYAGLFGATSGTAIVRNVGLEGGSITGRDNTGALVGNNAGIVSGNYSTASVTGSTDVGGLVGSNSGTVSNSYASGAVSGGTDVGGLVGLNSGTLSNNYATGAVSGTASVGGLVGANSGGTATGNFWDTTTTGQATSATGTGTGLTTAQMKLLATYSGASWDLASTWIVYDTNTYPLLRAFMTPLQVTFASNASKTYDGTSSWTAPSFTYSNPNVSLSGSLNYGAAGNAVNAGTYAITAGGLYSGQRGYAITSNTATLTIDKKAVTLTGATVTARDYDGTTAATVSGGSLVGVLSQDNVNIAVNTGTFDTKDAGTGKAVTAITTGSAGGNYIVTATGLTGTINRKALTVTGLAATTREYDAGIGATLTGGTLSGLIGSETLGLGTSAGVFANKNVGAGKAVTVMVGSLSNGSNGGLASNYTVTAPTGITGTITAKTLTWVNLALDPSKEYDGNTTGSINKGSLTGYVGGETLTSGSIATYADKNAGNNKVVTIHTTLGNGSGGLASNYTLADTTLTSSITPKALTVTGATAGNKDYDGTLAASITGGALSGMIGTETVGLGALSGAFGDKNAGTGKAVTVTGGSLSDGSNGGLASNYTLASVTGLTADIAQKALTVSGVSVASKSYDGNTKATISGGTLNGLVSGETLTLSGQSGAFNNKDAGNGKAVTVTGATLGNGSGLASNYTVSNATDATGNITQKALTVTGATASDKVYDGGTAATVNGGALDGLVSGETLGLGSVTGLFDDKNVASGKAVTVTGGALSDGTGGGLASNYTVGVSLASTASITPKALTVTGMSVSAKAYDGNTKASLTGGTLNGLVVGETVNFSGQAGVFADQNAGTGKSVTVTGITLSNAANLASNYSVANPTNVTGTITAKTLTWTNLAVGNKEYDGSTTASINKGSITGYVSGEGLISGSTAAFADKNAGNGKTVTVHTTLNNGSGGGLASNYTLADTSVTANITKATISAVTSIVVDSKVYDGGLNAIVNAAGATFAGMFNGDSLNVSATSANFIDKNAGSGKVVNAGGMTLGGTDAGNYNLTATTGTGTGTITQAQIASVSGITAAGKTYDGTDTATVSNAGATFAGMVNGDSLNVSATSANFIDKNAGSGKVVNAGGLTLGGTDAGNYNLTATTGTGTGTITQAQIASVSGITAAGKTYDGTDTATVSNAGATFAGMVNGDSLNVSATSANFIDKNAGSGKVVNASGLTLGGTDAGNYNLTATTGTGTGAITPKALTIIGMSAVSKAYDGNTKASVTGGSISGLVGTETLGVTGLTVTFDDKNAGTGKAVTATGTTLVNGGNGGLASNYTMANPTGFTANITPKALTVSGMTAATRVYDGTTAATLAGGSLSGVISGETLVLSGGTGVFVDKNAGNGKAVTVSGVSLADGTGLASNYSVTNPTNVKGSITQKVLTVTGALAADKTYDGALDATITGGSLSGFVGSETVGLAALAGAFGDKNAGSGKAVSVSGGTLSNGSNGGLASNYSVGPASGLIASIAQKALSVTGVAAANKVYDGTTKASVTGGSLSGLVGGETLGLSGLSGAFGDKNAGTGKAITVSGATLADGTGLASNYTVGNPTGVTANISQATISSVTNVVADSKVYDGGTSVTFAAATPTFNGMVSGDSLAIGATKAAFSDKNAGTGKAVTISSLTLGGIDAANYTLASTTATGTGTITPKALTITGMSAVNKAYDGSTKATLSGGSISGLVGTETLGVTGLSAAFDTRDAGTGKTVTATGSTLVNGGNGGLAANYTISNPSGLIASITPKALTVSGMTAGTRAYDGTTAATLAGGSLTGLVTGETLLVSGGSGVFADKNAGNGKAVTVSGISLLDGTGRASNYTVSNPSNVTGSITQKALSVTGALAADKTYDGALDTTITGGTLNGLVGSETVGMAAMVGAFADKNAGIGKAVSVTGGTLSNGSNGGLASNYTVSNPSGLTASITAKALTVAGQLAGNKVYDGNAQASLSGGALSGLVAGESLGIAGQTATFADRNAANGKAVTVTGTSLVDTITGLASNYTVSNPTGLTASITAKALTVTGQVAGSKVYDGNAQASLSGGVLSGLVAGESLGIAGQTAVFSDKNAANGKAVTVSGTTLVDTASGLASNYTVSNPTGLTASITARALTVTGQLAGNKVYDGNAEASLSGGALSGLVAGESLGIAGQSAVFSDKNAANGKAVTVTGTSLVDTASGLASNYTVSDPTGLTASITAKALTVTGQLAGNKVYDGNMAAQLSGGALAGLVAGESLGLAGQTATFADKNAANGKAVTVTGTSLVDTITGLASNYTVSNPTGLTASITPASLLVRATGAASRVYDTSTNASVTLADNRIAGDVLSISNSGASFADKNAGANKTVTVNGIALGGTDAGNYTVNATATTTASITQAELGVKVGNAEKDQGNVNPAFTASYTGLLGNDTLANEVSGNLAFSTPATIATPAGSYLVSAAGQTSINYALTYTPGVLTVKPTEARQAAVASVIAAANVAPSQGNMVQADVVAKGETVTSKEDAVQVAAERGQPQQGSTPVVLTTASVNSNVLPGLRLSVVDTGLRLPVAAGNTSVDSQ